MTKYKLIKLPDATIVVSDEQKINGDVCIHLTTFNKSIHHHVENDLYKWSKIIAGLQNLPTIKYNLSDEDAKKIGYVDVEKLAKIEFPKDDIVDMGTNITPAYRQGFEVGFQKAMELNDKKFSEEDIVKAINYGRFSSIINDYKFIQSLQTKIFDCEIEITDCVTVTKIL